MSAEHLECKQVVWGFDKCGVYGALCQHKECPFMESNRIECPVTMCFKKVKE